MARPEDSGYLKKQLTREFPAKKMSACQRKKYDILIKEYMRFLKQARTAEQVTDELESMLQAKGMEEKDLGVKIPKPKPFYMINDDRNSIAIVKPGTAPIEEGINIIITHSDSPCLLVKPRPLLFETDHEKKETHAGVRIDTVPYGSPQIYQWYGTPVDIVGYVVRNGRKKSISLPGMVADRAVHLDRRTGDMSLDEAHNPESIDIITGHESRKSFLDDIGLRSEDELAAAQIYVLPQTKVQSLPNDFVIAYGHDNKAGTFAGANAIIKAKPYMTSIVFVFDKEENGSFGMGSASDDFFEAVIDEITEIYPNKIRGQAKTRKLLRNSRGIIVDVHPAATSAEMVYEQVDVRNIPRMGYGPAVCVEKTTYQPTPRYVDFIMRTARKGEVVYHITGSGETADYVGLGSGSMSELFLGRRMQAIDIGMPVGNCHSTAEFIYGPDVFWTSELAKAFMESRVPLRKLR